VFISAMGGGKMEFSLSKKCGISSSFFG